MASPPPRLTLELEAASPGAASAPSPTNPKLLADYLCSPSPASAASPSQQAAADQGDDQAAAAVHQMRQRSESSGRLRSRSGVDIGDIGSNRAHRAGSPRRLGPRSTSARTLSRVGRTPSSVSSEPEAPRPSPGSVRGRLNRRRTRTTVGDNSLVASIVTLWRSERVIQTFCCGAPGAFIHIMYEDSSMQMKSL